MNDRDKVVSEIQIAAPPERVFQALTSSEELPRWFTNDGCPTRIWEIDPQRGGRWRSATQTGSKAVNGVSTFRSGGEILEVDPPRLLVYTWHANWHEDPSLATVVRWDLTEKDGGTFVRVTHSKLESEPTARKDYAGGWVGVLRNLKQFTEASRN
jgi:uncharacterized protein YndB with AHSA1/START domain